MPGGSYQRIGHGGADALAPANSLRSFDLAAELGVDMIEFDVRAHRGALVLAHTILDNRRPGRLSLEAALDHLARPSFDGIDLNLDVKHVGCETGMLEALAAAGLTGRAIISSQVGAVLDRTRALDPRVRLGISVGGRIARASQRWQRPWQPPVLAGFSSGRWDALMVHHRLISPGLVASVQDRGGAIHAWTVNERPRIRELAGLGVDGIVSRDPRLFRDEARAVPDRQHQLT